MKNIFTPLFLLLLVSSQAQTLKPGFDKQEYLEMVKVYSLQGEKDSVFRKGIPESEIYHRIYRSPVTGLDNRWDLLMGSNNVAIISIRGTTDKAISWVQNFYAAMVPASGEIKISGGNKFKYKLAQHPQAAVHLGWLIGLASMADGVVNKIDSCQRNGIKEFIVLGHSQGGAISFLMTSYLRYLQKDGKLPGELHFKTYCSAGPKPGNLYYAYDYENLTRDGWAYNVVNAADWVPETPISIQTKGDFNPTNPFTNARSMIRKQKMGARIVMKHIYKKLSKPTDKANRNYQKYLGRKISRIVQKQLKEHEVPVFYNSNNYVRAGNTIVLMGNSDYFKSFPDSKEAIFIHHMLQPYYYLAQQL